MDVVHQCFVFSMPERLFLPPAILTFPERVLGRVGAHWDKVRGCEGTKIVADLEGRGKGGGGGRGDIPFSARG